MIIFGGTSNQDLFKKIVEHICRYRVDASGGQVDISKFPDGEIHVKFNDNIRGKDVFLVQSTNNPVNDNLMELLIMIDAAKRASAARITAVMPFFAYARQDRKEQPRVPITAKLVADLLTAAGANRVLTMDLHSPQIQGFFNIPVDHLQALPVFVKYLKDLPLHEGGDPAVTWKNYNIVMVAPDVGRAKVAVQYAKALNCPVAIISKDRIDAVTVKTEALIGDVKDKTAIIIDDLSTTGGTLINASNLVKENGAKYVIAGVTHNVLTVEGAGKIERSSIDKMLITDTVQLDISHESENMEMVSVAEQFAEAIEAIHDNKSVSSLFAV